MNVMKKAWEIAKEAVVKFGGKVKEYFAESLKMAWATVKQNGLKSQLIELLERMKSNKETLETLEDNYEMALMHGQKSVADRQLSEVKAVGVEIKVKIQSIREIVGQETMKVWVKEEAATRK